jgi:hypothetical protein
MDDRKRSMAATGSEPSTQRLPRPGQAYEALRAGSVVVGCLGAIVVALSGSPWGVGAGLLGFAGVVVSFVGQLAARRP